ncbi:hypothetical protein AKO1_007865 [Acrasis kona]|uniref:Globin-sensor domain-containing protein n=1 Tax=Acrasis kona TaxID=1008807 RepID=A0AAW2YP98_9EUKA
MNDFDDERLDKEVHHRFLFNCRFYDFGEREISTLHANKDFILKVTPGIIEKFMKTTFEIGVTRKLLMPRIVGYYGELQSDYDTLSLESEIVKARGQLCADFFISYLTSDWSEEFVKGTFHKKMIHRWGNKEVVIDAVFNNAFYTLIRDAYIEAVFESTSVKGDKVLLVRALNKVTGLLNDLSHMYMVSDLDDQKESDDAIIGSVN